MRRKPLVALAKVCVVVALWPQPLSLIRVIVENVESFAARDTRGATVSSADAHAVRSMEL
jgi:hypothetical protein